MFWRPDLRNERQPSMSLLRSPDSTKHWNMRFCFTVCLSICVLLTCLHPPPRPWFGDCNPFDCNQPDEKGNKVYPAPRCFSRLTVFFLAFSFRKRSFSKSSFSRVTFFSCSFFIFSRIAFCACCTRLLFVFCPAESRFALSFSYSNPKRRAVSMCSVETSMNASIAYLVVGLDEVALFVKLGDHAEPVLADQFLTRRQLLTGPSHHSQQYTVTLSYQNIPCLQHVHFHSHIHFLSRVRLFLLFLLGFFRSFLLLFTQLQVAQLDLGALQIFCLSL